MTFQEERLARLKQQRSRQAINLAMQGRWREAVAANKVILENFPRDVDAHNRLGRAYMELGEFTQARGAYRRSVELDPFNAIAKKNLQRLSYLGEEAVTSEGESRKIEPHRFIEEIGKAEKKILEFCQRVRQNLQSLSYEERQLFLDALSVKVIAYRDRVELRGALPTYVTIERTWA